MLLAWCKKELLHVKYSDATIPNLAYHGLSMEKLASYKKLKHCACCYRYIVDALFCFLQKLVVHVIRLCMQRNVLLVGEVLGFENLVLGIFDFVHALIETPRHRALMMKYIEQLIYYVFHYMQMTEEQASLLALYWFFCNFYIQFCLIILLFYLKNCYVYF